MKPSRRLPARVLIVLALAAPVLFTQRSSAQADLSAIVARVSPAVVVIKGGGPAGHVTGAGFIVDSSGLIVTNFHVVHGLSTVAVKLSTGDIYDQVRVRAYDQRRDLVILQVAGFSLPTVPLADSSAVKPGQSVLLIGNPMGLESSVASGIVSAVREIEGLHVIQHDAASNPGNSGGPLLSSSGEAIGVLSFKLKHSEGLNFAIPINYVRGLLLVNDSLSLEDFSRKTSESTDLFSPTAVPTFPTRWRQNIGGSMTVRLVEDRLYIESDVAEDLKALGVAELVDYKREGSRYVGVGTGRFACQYASSVTWTSWGGEPRLNVCPVEYSSELTLVSPTRIEGFDVVYPEGTRFDCKRCRWDRKAVRQRRPFVLIPE